MPSCHFFFFNDTATTEIYTLSLHDALPILPLDTSLRVEDLESHLACEDCTKPNLFAFPAQSNFSGVKHPLERSEEHTSELQSRQYLVCRLLLEKKKNTQNI